MRCPEAWNPSRAQLRNGRWRASNDPEEVFVGSRLILDATLDNLFPLIRKHASGDILDLGCGKVPYFGLYREFVTRTICADWANTPTRSKHLDLVADLASPLPFRSGSFDTVLATDVLEHVPNPSDVWLEIVRVLRPNGIVLMTVPFLYWIHDAPHDYYRYTEFALRFQCRESALEVLDLRAIGGALSSIVDLVSKALASRGVPVVVLTVLGALGRRHIHGSGAQSYPLGYALAARKPSA